MGARSTPGDKGRALKIALDPMLVRGHPIPRVLEAAAEAGYRRLEWSARDDFLPVGRKPAATPSRVRELAASAAALGLEFVSVGAFYEWCSPDEGLRRGSVQHLITAIQLAGELGSPRVNTEFRGDPDQASASKSAFLRSVDEVLPALERAGVRLLVEPHPFDWLESNDQTVDLLTELASSRLGYIFCTPHTFNMGGAIAEQVSYAARLLEYAHIADTQRPERFIVNPAGGNVRVHQHLDVGRGEVDWEAAFAALAAVGFADGILTISVFSSPLAPEESFRVNLRAVTRLAERHGFVIG